MNKEIKVYSKKVGKEISFNKECISGKMQEYNVGLAPGSWY